jgi:hypothetical protein
MPLLVGAVLDRLFPGERQRQTEWLNAAATPKSKSTYETMAPPAPLNVTVSVPPLAAPKTAKATPAPAVPPKASR